ncbi:MAG: hypothetical protein WAN03_12230, partial [Candidatus Sulfotelmatobacter sp.]
MVTIQLYPKPLRMGRAAPVLVLLAALAFSLPLFSQAKAAIEVVHGAPHDAATDQAYDHFYNMEYDRALQEFERIVDRHPNDPFAVNHLLSAILMHDLYETGGMNTGDYSNDSFIGHSPRSTDPKVKERIKELVARAQSLEDARLKANPKDVDALYCRGVTRAQYAVYTGLIERAWFSALRNAVGARHD